QSIQRTAPQSHLRKMKNRRASELRRVEVLMSDGVSPFAQFLEQFLPAIVSGKIRVDFCPKRDSEAAKVRADVAGVRIPTVQRASPDKLSSQQSLQPDRGCRHDVLNAFRVKIPAEPLKLRRQKGRVSVVNLLRGITTPTLCAADAGVGIRNF